MMKLASLIGIFALVAGCATPVPNPIPSDVDSVFAGVDVRNLHRLSDEERDYFLDIMRSCEWHRERSTIPAPWSIFEIRRVGEEPEHILAYGSFFYVGQSYCQLASGPAFTLWQMAEPARRQAR